MHFYDLCVQKWSCLVWNSGAFWKFSLCEVYEKNQGAFSRFVRPKMKLFAVAFRCISEVLHLQGLQRKFWTNFHDLRVQKWSCLLWVSDAFCKLSACTIDKKVVGAFSQFMCCANKHSWLQYFVKKLWPRLIILHAHKSLLGCSGTLWSSWLSHFVRMLWIWTHLDCECTHKLWRASVTLWEAFSKKSWTGTSHMFCNIWTSKEWTDFVKFDQR